MAFHCTAVFKDVRVYWKTVVIIITPLLLLPLPLIYGEHAEARCAYVVLLMAIYWMTEVVPLAVTSFFPIFLFPLFHVLSVGDTCKTYLKDTNFLFFGGLMMAVAVEESNLHRRIALKVLLRMGAKPEWIMFGFMLVTAFLSMWMSNTATTAMMVPIAVAILIELQKQRKVNSNSFELGTKTNAHVEDPAAPVANGEFTREMWSDGENAVDDTKLEATGVCKGILLSICYAANIGGTGTLTGAGPNLVFRGQMDETFGDADTGITFVYWMAFAIPPMLVCLVIGWLLLQFAFFGRQNFAFRLYHRLTNRVADKTESKEENEQVEKMLLKEYARLGSISFAEYSVLFWFCILVALWIFRDPRFIPGWINLLGYSPKYMSDASSAMFIGCILFVWPRKRPNFYCSKDPDDSRPVLSHAGLLTWESMSSKFPWSVIMLLGGGFALAAGVKESGLSSLVGCALKRSLSSMSSFGMMAVFTILITFITEISSNTATAQIFIPIMISLAESLHRNPLLFALPSTIAPSFAFMLPVATPPNAIVYETGVVRIIEMMGVGFVMNWLCIGVTIVNMQTYARFVFPLDVYPEWAPIHNNSSSCS